MEPEPSSQGLWVSKGVQQIPGWKERRKSRPIVVSWTPAITAEERDAVVAGITDVFPFLPFPIRIMPPATTPACPLLEALDLSMTAIEGGQYDADAIITAIKRIVKDENRIDVVILDWNITVKRKDELLNFVFGLASSPDGILVLSVHQFRRKVNEVLPRLQVLRRIATHEFGHIMGLVNRETRDPRDGIYAEHCRNVCVMRQVTSMKEVFALDVALMNGRILLCDECRRELTNRWQ